MRVSIFWKLLGGFSVLLVLMLGSESYTLLTLDSAMTQYAHLLKHNQLLIDGVRSVQVDFKRQVQEWKNLLLRGRNATDFTKYHQSFLEKYEQVQTQAAEIQHLEMPQEHLKLLQQFIIEHQRLQLSYLEALRLLNVDEAYDARKADRSVRGQDRPPTELLDMLVEYIREDIQAKSDTLYQQTARKQTLLIGTFSLIFALFILTAFIMARNISRPLKELRGVLKEVANGNVQVSCSIRSADEIGDLATSTRDMIAYLQEVAHVTELVARDELDIQLTPRSEHDVLNYSVADMIGNLREMRETIQQSVIQAEKQYNAIKEQNWVKDGLSRLSSILTGNRSLTESCDIAIRTIARYMEAGQGVIYVYKPEQKILELQGSFAFTERDGLSRSYALGESVIGQVAQERKAILLTHAGREERLINSALISQVPLNTYALPLVYNDELFGVVELASFQPFDTQGQEFLTQAAHIIATAIFSAQQRTRSDELLQQARHAAQEAEAARENAQQNAQDAQKANARLEEQQQRLQQHNEEFKQLTAQLKEEQQQRLREGDERKQLEQRLERERHLLRKLVDNLPDYIYAKDRQSRFILANLPLSRSAGLSSPEELLGKTDFDLQPKALAETYYRVEQELMQTGQELREKEETFENSETGETTWLLTSKIPFRDQQEHVIGFIGIGRNITEYKRATEALQDLKEHFEQQLQERSAHLIRAKEELEQRVRELESV